MPEYIDTIICEDIRPEMGNKVTLAGVFGEELVLPQVPFQLPSLAIMQRWRLTNEEVDRGVGQFAYELEWPGHKRNRFPPHQMPPQKGVNLTTMSFVFKFVGLVLPAAGEYTFRTYLNDREVHSYKFYVVLPAQLVGPQQQRPAIGFRP
jgi:hypothetical protein